jgi:glycosyltransferase involved in cell wall biosynthesis
VTPVAVQVSRGREWRGGERQVALLARELARRGLPAPVATARGSLLAAELRTLDTVRELPWQMALDPRALRALHRTLDEMAPRPTLLHAHDSHALVIAGLTARRLGLPLVATRRSTSVPRRGGWWARAQKVVALSQAVREALEAGGVAPERITVIPSGLDLDALARRAERPVVDLPAEPYLLAVGALSWEKGHRVLLEAHARLAAPPLLLLAGDGPERPALLALAGELGTAARVRCLGIVTDPAPLILRARLLVQPSLREALGTAVIEALALGTPVIASATGGLPELLADTESTLVSPGDPAALATALAAELARPPHRVPVPRHIQRHDIRSVADALLTVYRSAT